MQRADPILVFDLDGTLLRLNSFPVWVLFLALGGVRKLRVRQQMRITGTVVRLLMLRKLGRIRHPELLRSMRALWHGATSNGNTPATARLVELLARCVRSNVTPALRLVREGDLDGIIATAAADDYAVALGQRLGVANILATRTGDEPENSGVHKRNRLLAWLNGRGWSGRPLIFFNDHMADLPLMRESHVVCWFGSTRSLKAAREAAADVRFVDCRALNAHEMRAVLAHLCQSVTFVQVRSERPGQRANTFA